MNIEHLSPLSSVLEALSYVYDLNGNRISMNRQSANLPLPNSVTNTSYNQANQMMTFTPSTGSVKNMTYDNNGNMTSVTNSCGTSTYDWDARNRLVGINGYKPDCSPLTASFEYDALGRRIQKTTTRTGTVTDTMYLYDGLDIVQEIENGLVSANYIRTLNIDEPLARIKADGTVRYYQTDALGSVIALTDEAGTIRTQYTYDPYGNVTVSGEASDNPFQYTGRENDGTGLYYYRFRYYSPQLQRFISEDPLSLSQVIILRQISTTSDIANLIYRFAIMNPQVLNKYPYVGNNPPIYTDPYGLIKINREKVIRVGTGLGIATAGFYTSGLGFLFIYAAAAEAAAATATTPLGAMFLSVGIVHTAGVGVGLVGAGAYGMYYGLEYAIEGLKDKPKTDAQGSSVPPCKKK